MHSKALAIFIAAVWTQQVAATDLGCVSSWQSSCSDAFSVSATYGTAYSYPCPSKAFLDLAPTDWCKRLIAPSTVYYYDKDKLPSGLDHDAGNGVDTSMLFFYAGHSGSTDSWESLAEPRAVLDNVLLGDFGNPLLTDNSDGLLRYYWQCSCRTFAHGPLDLNTGDYSSPERFNENSILGEYYNPNVVRRWSNALGGGVRMACGSSTDLYCDNEKVEAIWENYYNGLYDVADSFLVGMQREPGEVPLCLAPGGATAGKSAFYDKRFSPQKNEFGISYYYSMYVVEFKSNSPVDGMPPSIPPPPVVYAVDGVDPLSAKGRILLCEDEILGANSTRIPEAVEHYYCGSFKGHEPDPGMPGLEADYIKTAKAFVISRGWAAEAELSSPRGLRLVIDKFKLDGEFLERFQKNIVVRFGKVIEGQAEVDPRQGISIQMNNKGEIVSASRRWVDLISRILPPSEEVLSFKDAEEIVRGRLFSDGSQIYRLEDDSVWRYQKVGERIEPVFVFKLVPTEERREIDSPVLVEVSAIRLRK